MHIGEEQARKRRWVLPGDCRGDRWVGYWRTGTSTTEMQIPVEVEKVVPELEAWVENFYVVYLQRTLNLKEVFGSLETYWPIRAWRRTCQSEEKAGFPGALVPVPLRS